MKLNKLNLSVSSVTFGCIAASTVKVFRWDKNDQLRFARLDQKLFTSFAHERNLTLEKLDTVVAWDQEYSYALEAQAAFMVLRRLGEINT